MNNGYHIANISKGVYTEHTKITEEYEEFFDSVAQECKVMQAIELSDLIGAIEGYAVKHLNLTLEDLIKFSKITSKAFKEGYRISSSPKTKVITSKLDTAKYGKVVKLN